MKLKALRLLDILPLPPIYYDVRKDYYVPDAHGGWVSVNERSLPSELRLRGIGCFTHEKDVISEAAEAVNKIQKTNHVDFVGRLAGWKKGFHVTRNARLLVTESPILIEPKKGNWEILNQFLTGLLGTEQMMYFCGWTKVAVEAIRSGQPRTGQALVLCGPADSGKNLLRKVVTGLFGGRVAFPYQFMCTNTAFNHDLFGAETLAIEDEAGSRSHTARQNFGAAIKNITANEDQRYHRKYGDPLTLTPCQRLVISLNDEPVRLLVLPPVESDIADKLMLFKVIRREMPMPTDTSQRKAAFWSALLKELPAFLSYLDEYEIPDDMRSNRFGIKHYHNPALLAALEELSAEEKLRDLIDEIVFTSARPVTPWIGKAEELRSELRRNSSRLREVDEILPHPTSCGVLLGKLRNRYPERFRDALIQGRTRWTIEAPDSLGAGAHKMQCNVQRMRDILAAQKSADDPVAAEKYASEERAVIKRADELDAARLEIARAASGRNGAA